MDEERNQGSDVRRYVIIVDTACRVVAREETSDPLFMPYAMGESLPFEVEALVKRRSDRARTHVLAAGCLMHVVPIRGTAQKLRALVFEELRVRSRR